jgi:hypothetical protein
MKMPIVLLALLMLAGSYFVFTPKAEAQFPPSTYEPVFFCCVTIFGQQKTAVFCAAGPNQVCTPDTSGCFEFCVDEL